MTYYRVLQLYYFFNFVLLKIKRLSIIMRICEKGWTCLGTLRDQKWALDSLELGLQAVSCRVLIIRTELRSSRRAASILNLWAISAAPTILILTIWIMCALISFYVDLQYSFSYVIVHWVTLSINHCSISGGMRYLQFILYALE